MQLCNIVPVELEKEMLQDYLQTNIIFIALSLVNNHPPCRQIKVYFHNKP